MVQNILIPLDSNFHKIPSDIDINLLIKLFTRKHLGRRYGFIVLVVLKWSSIVVGRKTSNINTSMGNDVNTLVCKALA